MDPQERPSPDDRRKARDRHPRSGSLHSEVERAEREPEPHHGKQLIGD